MEYGRNMILMMLSIIILFNGGCADKIITVCDENVPGVVVNSNYASIQKNVLDKSCALAGCHAGANPPSGLLLTPETSYTNLVNADNYEQTMKRVKPGDSKNSYLIKIMTANDFTVMPPATKGGKLPQAVVDSIAAWIDKGALNN